MFLKLLGSRLVETQKAMTIGFCRYRMISVSSEVNGGFNMFFCSNLVWLDSRLERKIPVVYFNQYLQKTHSQTWWRAVIIYIGIPWRHRKFQDAIIFQRMMSCETEMLEKNTSNPFDINKCGTEMFCNNQSLKHRNQGISKRLECPFQSNDLQL